MASHTRSITPGRQRRVHHLTDRATARAHPRGEALKAL
jgi:hypothetical protein